ncbi:MAG TPA: hypothetical protein DCK87_07875 [Desulfotomaculum sp.]|nr:hypothetical protein [Desulfotomaculum sp.]
MKFWAPQSRWRIYAIWRYGWTRAGQGYRDRPGKWPRPIRNLLAALKMGKATYPNSMGKARMLVRMTRWKFKELLGRRHIPHHYTREDLEEDLHYARGH